MGVALRLGEYMSRTGTQNEQRLTFAQGATTAVLVGTSTLWESVGAQCRKRPALNVGTTLVDSSTAWRLAINMWHWMVQERLLGLSKHVVPCMLMCGSSSSSFGTVGFLFSLTEQVYLKRCLVLAAFAKCVMISAADVHLAWRQV